MDELKVMTQMKKIYHILNGDALKEQFPKKIEGEIIVARECLVDGKVESEGLEGLFEVRAQFISENYNGSVSDYYTQTVSEFEKIKNIPAKSEVNLWFEDDLFCQVNFWFVAHLIFHHLKEVEVFLVRPEVHTSFGFGGLSQDELAQVLRDKVMLKELDKIASLWNYYKNDEQERLLKVVNDLKDAYPFMVTAVKAHIERIPTKESPGRPTQVLIQIMRELKTTEFAPVFREFNKRESIYGFGDLQVKKLFDKINSQLS